MSDTERMLRDKNNKLIIEIEELKKENKNLKIGLELAGGMKDIAVDKVINASDRIRELEEENKKLKEERDFFKEQAILWRKDYKNEYEKNRKLEEELEKDNRELQVDVDKELLKANDYLIKENKKLNNAIEYRKKKADKNQEKANEIDKIMNLPGVMVDGKIDWSKVAVYYMM